MENIGSEFEFIYKNGDIEDIFYHIRENNIDIHDYFICYKVQTEYGCVIKIIDHKTIEYLCLMINKNIDGTYKINHNIFISSCVYKQNKGLIEHIYSNRSEFFIDNTFICYNYDNNDIITIIRKINKLLLDDKIYPELYNFIVSDKKICLIPSEKIYYRDDLFTHQITQNIK